jgi:hypothetical protein
MPTEAVRQALRERLDARGRRNENPWRQVDF